MGIWLAAARQQQSGRAVEPVVTVSRTLALSPASACLLTDASGTSGTAAAAVWDGIKDAGTARTARVSFLAVHEHTDATAVLNALLARRLSRVNLLGQIRLDLGRR